MRFASSNHKLICLSVLKSFIAAIIVKFIRGSVGRMVAERERERERTFELAVRTLDDLTNPLESITQLFLHRRAPTFKKFLHSGNPIRENPFKLIFSILSTATGIGAFRLS